MAPLMVPKWCHEPETVRREPPPPARGRRRGRRGSGPGARGAACRSAGGGDPAHLAGRAGGGGRGDHHRARAGLGRAAPARARPRVRGHATAGRPVRRGPGRRRRRPDARRSRGGRGHRVADQPAPARPPQGPDRAGSRERRAVGQRLARASGRRRAGTKRAAPSTRTTRLQGRPALHRLGALANTQELHMPTFDTPEPISVTVELGVGDLRIVASDRTDTQVEVRPSDAAKKADVAAAEQTRVEYTGGRLLIKAPKNWRQYTFRGGGESIDVQVELPAGSHLRGETGVAALRCSGRLGECRYKTGVGDIRLDQAGAVQLRTGVGDIIVEGADGDAELTTGSGSLRIDRVGGAAVVKNSNGDTWIGEVAGDLRVNAGNGRISVEQARETVAAKSANGDVRLGEVAHGTVLAQTAFGKVEIGIRDGVAAWLDLNTRFGNVNNDLDATGRPDQGEDAVEVRARTAFGDITVHRSLAHETGKEEA